MKLTILLVQASVWWVLPTEIEAQCNDPENVGFWKFKDEDVGSPVKDCSVAVTGGHANDGFVGLYPQFQDTTNLLDRGMGRPRVSFQEGESSTDSIIMIDDSVDNDFNPGMETFIWRAKVKLEVSTLDPAVTWNLLQKGRSNQKGMWKMQIKPFRPGLWDNDDQSDSAAKLEEIENGFTDAYGTQASLNDPILHCQVQDEESKTLNAYSRVKIQQGKLYRLRCVLDRKYGKLKAIVETNAEGKRIDDDSPLQVFTNKIPAGFGEVSPGVHKTFYCPTRTNKPENWWIPEEFASPTNLNDFVAIGNKPNCPGWENNPANLDKIEDQRADAFKGKVYQVKISKPNWFD